MRVAEALDGLKSAPDVSGATIAFYEAKGRPLAAALGFLSVAEVTPRRVAAYVAGREAAGVGRGTVHKELCVLRKALALAGVKDPSGTVPRLKHKSMPRRRFLAPAELAVLRPCLDPERAWWVTVACYCGGRRSEVEALRWEQHVDLEGGRLLILGTKTEAAERWVPLPGWLVAEMRERAQPSGTVVRPWAGNINRDLRRACARAGIPRCSPNDLRRTFASWLVQAGVSSYQVAKLLGHTTSRMVEKVYGHLNDASARAAVATLPALEAP